LNDQWINDERPASKDDMIEPPPEGFQDITARLRPLCLEDPATGERREVTGTTEIEDYRKRGWKLILRRDDYLELLHLQAWYFQVRHFPRLRWVRLDAPEGEWFITSDRGVTWLVDGFADTPPAALRHPTTQVVAPLTRKLVLVGRHETQNLNVTPREVNRLIAFTASDWVAGPTSEVVERAIIDRDELLG